MDGTAPIRLAQEVLRPVAVTVRAMTLQAWLGVYRSYTWAPAGASTARWNSGGERVKKAQQAVSFALNIDLPGVVSRRKRVRAGPRPVILGILPGLPCLSARPFLPGLPPPFEASPLVLPPPGCRDLGSRLSSNQGLVSGMRW